MRTCTRCKRPQPLSEFTKHKKEKDGIRKYCRACAKVMKKAWHVRNYVPGSDYYKKVQVSGQERIKSGKNATHCRQMYIKHREKRLESLARYKEANKERVSQWKKDYKWRVRGAEGKSTLEQIQARIDYYGGLCWLCRAPYQEIDHVKPVSKGGSNWPVNLRPICSPCNKSKSAKWPLEKVHA